ncbi:MAG: hypothetical protein HY855_25040 [Burkholderiales bacterium]|nr:hypothetical protein [Burkholderiales bacterium]
MKQRQNRPKSRAPHGSPRYTKQFGFWCAASLHRDLKRAGGSEFARAALAEAIAKWKEQRK